MTKSELKPLYVEACTRARSTPQKSEEAVWFSCIGYADIRDMQAALNAHFEHSSWMPKESELKPLIERNKSSRLSQTREKEELSAWKCTECGTGITSFKLGFLPYHCDGLIPIGPDKGKRCLSSTFNLLYRGAAA